MERKYSDYNKLKAAGKFLEEKGLDIMEYTIFDTSGKYKQQIPIATWLTDYAEMCVSHALSDRDNEKCNLANVKGRAFCGYCQNDAFAIVDGKHFCSHCGHDYKP